MKFLKQFSIFDFCVCGGGGVVKYICYIKLWVVEREGKVVIKLDQEICNSCIVVRIIVFN